MPVPGPPPPSTPGARPGWYPDPSGRNEYRYHNGTGWTADVATDGQRYVDPLSGVARAGGPGNGIAIAALTCGILALAVGWLPVIFVVGAVLAVLAIAFGIVGLRRSRRLGRRGLALAGLLTGIAGVVMAVVGLVFTVTVFRALDRYENPEPHTVSITSCDVVDGSATVEGWIRNDGDARAGYTVVVTVERPGSGLPVAAAREPIEPRAAGATVEWTVRRPVTIDEVTCADPEVTGPLPFGVVPPS
ncbi:MAG: DUF2510 domain-containing protein [Ilumatobacteraceae bacterium]